VSLEKDNPHGGVAGTVICALSGAKKASKRLQSGYLCSFQEVA
jgi:hypothetical protein